MEPGSRTAAEAAAAAVARAGTAGRLIVHDVTERDVARRPKPPFTTSTLQQEASSRLGFGAARTMFAAQAGSTTLNKHPTSYTLNLAPWTLHPTP